MDPSAFIQSYWQIRSDDSVGLNTDSGWAAGENTQATIGTGIPFRIRIKVRETASGNENKNFKLQVRRNTGSWIDVGIDGDATSCTPAILFPSTQFSHGDATSSELLTSTAASYVNGEGITTSNSTTIYSYSNEETEFEFCLKIQSFHDNYVQNVEDDELEFRMVESDGTAFTGTYSYPLVVVTETPGFIGGSFIETPNRIGPYVDTNDNLYYIIEPTLTDPVDTPIMIKSTDGGDTWREVDGTNRPAVDRHECICIDQDGDTLHIGQQTGTENVYHRFRMSDHPTNPDTWELTDEDIVTGADYDVQQCSIEARSDGTVVYFWGELNGTYRRINYSIRSAGGTWGSTNNLDTTATTNFTSISTIKDSSETIYAFYKDDTNLTLYYKTLTSGDSLSGRTSVATGLINDASNNDDVPQTPAIYYDDGGVEVVMIAYKLETDQKLYARAIRDGSLQTAAVVSDASISHAQGQTDQVTADLAVDQSTKTAYALWGDSATDDLFMDTNVDEGGWGTDVELLDGKTITRVRSYVIPYSDGRTVLAVTYDNGGSDTHVGYVWFYEHFLYGSVSAEQAAYINGAAATQASAEQVAYIHGLGSISAGQAAYVRGYDSAQAEQVAYIDGYDSISTEQVAYIHGLDSISTEQVAYIGGFLSISTEQVSYLAGFESISTEQIAYVAGLGSISAEQVAYILGGNSIVTEQVAYIAGYGAVSAEQVAYIRGHITLWKEEGMAITKSSTQITWSASNSVSVSSSGTQTSDAFTFDSTSIDAQITIKADNSTTPASGDTVDFYLLYTTGDPDGSGSDEYDTTIQGTHLGTLDTNITDPAQKTVRISAAAKGGKIYAVNNSTANAITVSAEIYEIKAA